MKWSRRAGLEAEDRRGSLAGPLGSCGEEARLGRHPPTPHLIGEAKAAGEVMVHPRTENSGPPAADALDALLASEIRERAPHGDQAAAVLVGQVALGRQPVAGLPFLGVEAAVRSR